MNQIAENIIDLSDVSRFFTFMFGQDIGAVMVLTGSLLVSCTIFGTRRWHIAISGRTHEGGLRQALHRAPTPRIGGVAVMSGLVLGAVFYSREGMALPALVALSALPVFRAGLAEDVFHSVTPRLRLLAAAAGGLLAASMTGLWIREIGVPWLDPLLAFAPVGILFTAFATTGIAHAFNLVDGLNGLSSGIAMLVSVSLGAMALAVGDIGVCVTAGIVFLSCAGFWFLNYPFGKIFLGDAGAYTTGHVLAWLAVVLATRNPEISPWAMLLVFMWPLKDTMFAIWRRARKGLPASAPDRLHFHHVVLRALEASVLRGRSRTTANATASLLVLICAGVPSLFAVAHAGDSQSAAALFVVFIALNLGIYGLLVRAVERRGRIFRAMA